MKTPSKPQRFILAYLADLERLTWHSDTTAGEFVARPRLIDTTAHYSRHDCDLGEITGHGCAYGLTQWVNDLEHARFRVWLDREGKHYGHGGFLSFELGDRASLHDLERATKSGKSICKALDAITAKRSYAADVADSFGRFLEAVRCEVVLIRRDDEQTEITGHRFRVATVADAIYWTRDKLRKLAEECAPASAT